MRTTARLVAAAVAVLPALLAPAADARVGSGRLYTIDLCLPATGTADQGVLGDPVRCPGDPAVPAEAGCRVDRVPPQLASLIVQRPPNCTITVPDGYYQFSLCETGNLGHQVFVTGPGSEFAELDFTAAVVAGQGYLTGFVNGVDAGGVPFRGTASGPVSLRWSGAPCAAHSLLRVTAVVAMADGV
jgi:hypothetical protein